MASQCRVCRKSLPDNAKKCTECGEFQSQFRRFLLGIDLQSLVALVPIVTLAVVFLWERVQPPGADMRVKLAECRKDKVVLAVANYGPHEGIIGRVSYRVNDGDERRFKSIEDDQRLLKSGKARMLVFHPDGHGILVPHPERKEGCTISVRIETDAFVEDSNPKEERCDCPDYTSP